MAELEILTRLLVEEIHAYDMYEVICMYANMSEKLQDCKISEDWQDPPSLAE